MIAAGALGMALQANAASVSYNITGNLSPVDNSCTQIVFLLGGGDCSYAFGRGAPNAWYGPSMGASYYAVGSTGDSTSPAPPGTPTDKAASLRKTFMDTLVDLQLTALRAEKQKPPSAKSKAAPATAPEASGPAATPKEKTK
jgi:hypothetical protein